MKMFNKEHKQITSFQGMGVEGEETPLLKNPDTEGEAKERMFIIPQI